MIPRRLQVAALIVLALAAAGCLKDVDADPEARLLVEDVDVAAAEVTAGQVRIEVTPTLRNRGGPGSANMTVKAFDTATGLRIARNTTTVQGIPEDGTATPSVLLDVPREDGVRVEVDLGSSDRVRQTARVTVSNLEGLSPTVHSTPLTVGKMDFVVRDVTGGNGSQDVRIETRIYLTNEGGEASDTVRLQAKAREANTSLLGDENWTSVGTVQPGATRIVPVNLTVPDGHNYRVEVALWRDDFVLERGRGAVQLLPTEIREKGTEVEVSDPDVRDFQRDDEREAGEGARADGAGVPGPGAGLVAAAALGAALLARRGDPR
jgi:hypothetical protein